MKQLTSSEKFALIRDHGTALCKVGYGIPADKRSDVLASAERIIELAKSIPKHEWGVEG